VAAVTFRVIDADAPRKAVAENIIDIAQRIASAASANTPRLTGLMASSWRVTSVEPGTAVVSNSVPYATYVEYGTRYMAARAPLGRALAAGG
jgi:Bacteriophage HK97-gp10, putative tail-component